MTTEEQVHSETAPAPVKETAPTSPAPRGTSRLLLILVVAVALVSLTFWSTYSAGSTSAEARALAFAAWATVDLVLGPASEDYHYTVLLAPIAIPPSRQAFCRTVCKSCSRARLPSPSSSFATTSTPPSAFLP